MPNCKVCGEKTTGGVVVHTDCFNDMVAEIEKLRQHVSWNSRHEELFLEIKARDKIIEEYEDKIERGELVEVVRCKDCVYVEHGGINNAIYCCTLRKSWWTANYYCCSGEKRSDNNA